MHNGYPGVGRGTLIFSYICIWRLDPFWEILDFEFQYSFIIIIIIIIFFFSFVPHHHQPPPLADK